MTRETVRVLAVFSGDGRTEALESRLSAGWSVCAASDWAQFERAAATADCAVVVLTPAAAEAGARRLAALRVRHPSLRVLVVAPELPGLNGARAEMADEVIPPSEMARELPAALGRACILSRTRKLPQAVREAGHVPARLRQALATASNGGAPVRTVEKLAVLAGCDRRTLWNQWRHAFGEGEGLRLQDYLHWLLLLRATARKTPDRSWGDVADEIGVHPHTLGRLARQLAGRSLRDLAAGGQTALAERFDETVLSRFAPPPSPEPA